MHRRFFKEEKMKKIAKFHKVSENRFLKDWKDKFPEASEEEIREIYSRIALPKRATAGSAGYDFFAPSDVSLAPGEIITIPTGIRAEMKEEWVLKCYPRSGLGFKYRLQLNNTVGIIDSDYFYSDNEGHIFQRLPMTPTKEKLPVWSQELALCREFSLNTGLLLMMM